MAKENKSKLIIWAAVALVIGVIIGLLITNITTTGEAKSGLKSKTTTDDSGITDNQRNYVLNLLNNCSAVEMGQAEPMIYFGRSYASGNDVCNWKSQQTGQSLTCIQAGRIYANNENMQTGYGVWSCGRQDVVSEGSHNGWALCCPN